VVRDGLAPRKQRTRQHVIAAQSANYVERFIVEEGHSAERVASDYGYDLLVFTYDEDGFSEEGLITLQLKAADELIASGDHFVFDMDVRDHARWVAEPMPVILILFDASKKRAYWLYVQRYFGEDESRGPRPAARSIRVHVPKRQGLTRKAVRKMREYKARILEQLEGVIDHG
jgi:hypothetical protein